MPVARIIASSFEDALTLSEQLRAQFDTIEIAAPGKSFAGSVDLEVTLESCSPEQALAQIAAFGNRNNATVFVAPGTLVENSSAVPNVIAPRGMSPNVVAPNVMINDNVSSEPRTAQRISQPLSVAPQNGGSHSVASGPTAQKNPTRQGSPAQEPAPAQQNSLNSMAASSRAANSAAEQRLAATRILQPIQTWIESFRNALEHWSGRQALLRDVRAAERQRQAEAAAESELQRELGRARLAQEAERIRQASLEIDRQLRAEEAQKLAVLRSVEERRQLREEIDRKRREEFERERLAAIAEKHRLEVEARLQLERQDALRRAVQQARIAQEHAEQIALQAAQQREAQRKEAQQREAQQREAQQREREAQQRERLDQEEQERVTAQVSARAQGGGAPAERSLPEEEAAKLRALAEIGAAAPGSQPAQRLAAHQSYTQRSSAHRSTTPNPVARRRRPAQGRPAHAPRWRAAATSAALVSVFAMIGWVAYANRRPASPLSGSATRQSQVRQSQVQPPHAPASVGPTIVTPTSAGSAEAPTAPAAPKIIPVSVTTERTLQSASTTRTASTSVRRRVRHSRNAADDVAEDVVVRHFAPSQPSPATTADTPTQLTTEAVPTPSTPTFARAANKPVKQISDLN
jgi:hypothetical protein